MTVDNVVLLMSNFYEEIAAVRYRPPTVCSLVIIPPSSSSSPHHSAAGNTAASDEEEPSVRQARAAGQQALAQPVDCVLSEWSAWSRCDTCQKKRVSVLAAVGGKASSSACPCVFTLSGALNAHYYE